MHALRRHLPQLAAAIPAVSIGNWPTPISCVEVYGRPLWIKNEGLSHPLYGGNKIRTLEVWFGHALARGARRIWSIGAYGSNHAIATVLHAGSYGLEPGVILFPQPATRWAFENCRGMIGSGCPIIRVRSVVELPFAYLSVQRRDRHAIVMPPGGATTLGAFGAMSAIFELADQIAQDHAPPPTRIVVPVGSTCTTAGLLAGVVLARAAGVWRWPAPLIHAVRVTPWPVTSHMRIVAYSARVLELATKLGGPRTTNRLGELRRGLVVDPRELGAGYGQPTARASQAIATLHGPRLDAVYAAKAAAALLRLHARDRGPLLFWATKSMSEVPDPLSVAGPPALRRWLTRTLASERH